MQCFYGSGRGSCRCHWAVGQTDHARRQGDDETDLEELPRTFKDLRLANDSFEYEPEKRAGAAAVFRNTKRVRTMKVDVKRRRDERFATWQRRIEVRREQKAVFERENIAR